VFRIQSHARLAQLSRRLPLHSGDAGFKEFQFDKDSAKEEDSEQEADAYLTGDRFPSTGGAAGMGEGENIQTILHKLEKTVEQLGYRNKDALFPHSVPQETHPLLSGTFREDLVVPIANIMTLHLSTGARLLLLGCLLQDAVSGGKRHYCFNEIASMIGISDRTAYRALKEIKASAIFKVDSRPGIGVSIELDCIKHRLKDEGKALLCGSTVTSEEADLFH